MSPCKCGRPFNMKPHCPRCGSSFVYGVKSQNRNGEIRGQQVVIRAFQCRGCSMPFDDSMECEAPLTKDAIRQNEYTSQQAIDRANKMIQAKSEHYEGIVDAVRDGHILLTRHREDNFQSLYGESLSRITGRPVIEPITEDILPPADDPEGPKVVVTMTDEQWKAWIATQKENEQ